MTMEKVFVVGNKKYDKTSREFKVTYEDGGTTSATTTDTVVFSVPSGKTFYLRTLSINNEAGATNIITIKDGKAVKMKITIPADESKEITDIKGALFTTNVTAACFTGTATVFAGGEVTEL